MDKDTFNTVLEHGIKAPSGDNVQPWKIAPYDGFLGFDLFTEENNDDFFDINHNAGFMDCGTLLENTRLSALHHGYDAEISLDNDWSSLKAASVSFTPATKKENTSMIDEMLYSQIGKRAAQRVPFSRDDLPPDFYKELKIICDRYKDAKLIILKNKRADAEEKEKTLSKKAEQVKELLYRTETLRYTVQGAHHTVSHNFRLNKRQVNSTRTGLDYRTLGIPLLPKATAYMLSSWSFQRFMNTFGGQYLMAGISAKKPLDKSAGIGIITIKENSKSLLIRSAMLWESIWLLLAKYDAYLQPFATLNFFIRRVDAGGEGFDEKQRVLLRSVYKRFKEIVGMKDLEELSMCFRYGKAPEPKVRSLRKPLESFLQQAQ